MKQGKRKGVAVLGATGSIGTQALEVIRANRERFSVEVLTAYQNAELLLAQAHEFQPEIVVIGDEGKYRFLADALSGSGIHVYCGKEALKDAVQLPSVDVVLTAMVGAAGLEPTIAAMEAGKDVALANKETLVIGGSFIMELVKRRNIRLLPVDSEHSAIFQCLAGAEAPQVEKIILTASGGPFRGWSLDALREVGVQQALKHPNWAMGAKITIDSASLMNKGLEVIEAKWLFDLRPDQIEVVVHPQSIIHSMVQFQDGSVLAQMGLPDMKLPIQYALGYPDRVPNDFPRLDFLKYPELSFETPDRETFRNLDLAYEALRMGGNMPCVLNAANEVAVSAFLNGKIGFLQMSDVIEQTMARISYSGNLCLDTCLETDQESRELASSFLN